MKAIVFINTRITILTIVTLLCSLITYGQKRITYSNIFFSNDRLSGCEIWLNYDSTYFFTCSNCGESDVTKGNYKLIRDTLTLNPFSDSKLENTFEIISTKQKNVNTCILTFVDYFNLPLGYLDVTFFNDTNYLQTKTDSFGVIKLENKNYHSIVIETIINPFYSKTDTSEYGMRYLINTTMNDLTFKCEYPSEIIFSRNQTTVIKGDKEYFIRAKGNILISPETKREYKKKY